jgi:hypothetical protein
MIYGKFRAKRAALFFFQYSPVRQRKVSETYQEQILKIQFLHTMRLIFGKVGALPAVAKCKKYTGIIIFIHEKVHA